MRGNRRGAILVENIIFIILNLIFLTILILFIARQGEGAIVLEQSYAKEIALMIDSAKPGMTLQFDMKEGRELAEKKGANFKDIVKINENVVTVKLTDDEGGGFSYSFFNDVQVSEPYPDATNKFAYVIMIGGYN